MAQKSVITFTAYKIVTPQNAIVLGGTSSGPLTSASATRVVTLSFQGQSVCFFPTAPRSGSSSTDDTIVMTSDGWQFYITQESADVATALSSTDMTTS